MKKVRVIVAVAVLVCISMPFWDWRRLPVEPSYDGTRLSDWLVAYRSSGVLPRATIDQAICEMGTNTIPFLLAWEGVRESPLKLRLLDWARRVKFLKGNCSFDDRLDMVAQALLALRCRANDEVRTLVQIYEGKAAYHYRGPPGRLMGRIVNLIERPALEEANRRIQTTHGADANIVLPLLLRETINPDSWVRRNAYWGLIGLTNSPETVVPILINGLRDADNVARKDAAQALGFYGSNAISAVPALKQFCKEAEEFFKSPHPRKKLHDPVPDSDMYWLAYQTACESLVVIEKHRAESR